MGSVGASYSVELGFTPRSQTFPDPDRPPLLRARPRPAGPYGDNGIERQRCDAVDLCEDAAVPGDLFECGFDRVDLTDHDSLQHVLAAVRREGRISSSDGEAIRAALAGAALRCSGGRALTVLHVADEGLIMRTAGPNRLALAGARSKGMNGHGPALSVHTDQDVHGTPLVELMDGRAPSLFRHDAPDSSNHEASLMLVNLWIPLQQITEPLLLGDGRTVDRLRHQLCYGLPTDSFLDRDEDQVINDIWTYTHDPGLRWYFSSEMDHRSAYVFDTLSTPHGAGVLPGEDVAERCYLALEATEYAIAHRDAAEIGVDVTEAAALPVPDRAPPALKEAIAAMLGLLQEATTLDVMDSDAPAWATRSSELRRSVVRMSIELRLVVSTAA